jgi:hypothetical protein
MLFAIPFVANELPANKPAPYFHFATLGLTSKDAGPLTL